MNHHLKSDFMTAFSFDDMMNCDREARAYVLDLAESGKGV